jgi:signal transduction histidine kinase
VFKNLRTGTKLIILCCTFIVAIGVTTYSLVAEKRMAIDFARKELLGNRYLAKLRETYAAILFLPVNEESVAPTTPSADEVLTLLAAAQTETAGAFQTAELERPLAAALRDLWSKRAEGGTLDALVLAALANGQRLASRVGDDSNLSLDPDLDSYYLQDIVAKKLPTLLGELGEMHTLVRGSDAPDSSSEIAVRLLVLDGLLRSTLDGVQSHLAAAYRGNSDGSLRPSVDTAFAAMTSGIEAFLGELRAGTAGHATAGTATSLDRAYAAAVASAIRSWAMAQAALDRLLQERIDALFGRMRFSLALTGALAGLSILIAVMTHRHIVRPLERLEHTASTVRETKNYNVRLDYSSHDEIGRLAVAFNEMLAELAAARERDLSKQSELARVTRLTTMGAMTASIAHEINQPLAAIVTSSNAGLRWLARDAPDLAEARAALQRIANDGHRASQVIGSIRSMFRNDARERTAVDVNHLIREALALVDGDLQRMSVSVHTELAGQLPPVLADQIQLQQVIVNLVTNAVDAMRPVTERARVLRVRSARDAANGVRVMVEDSGTGIDPQAAERIFDPFFTTKSNGMGLGLSICRSIVEAHGGRLWASPGNPHGSVLEFVLPSHDPGAAR